ncbi:methyltransferase [Phytohabitans sp. ZYX-F-186]|uniref:Methyltransferase n=1 Tax=Phytohabitans maris TaxID=3071409 RepID=A0ABU0ZLY8_9ACTN|nr:methyltransferase [Phytohabitans sp. ZYX-F-186]MDQ7907404.1 methyltransferase [Phytohabitans sp. ZYX-F-186]
MPPGSTDARDTARSILDVAFGAAAAGTLLAATRLGVADALDDEPAHVSDLAGRTRTDPDALDRLLRALTQQGIFEEVEEGWYRHTESSRALREDAPDSLRYMVLWLGAEWTWRAWPLLAEAVRRGGPVTEDLFGKGFYAYLKQDTPEEERNFMRAMTQSSERSSSAVVEVLDMRGVRRVADIGGGQGHLLRKLLERHPGAHGVLLDLETVVPNVDPALRREPLSQRCDIVAGDFLSEVPGNADLYILKNIVEGPDESSVAVLRNIAAAARPGARIAVVSTLLDTGADEMRITVGWDLTLLLNVGGKKHRARDLVGIFEKVGLTVLSSRAIPGTLPTLHLFECVVPVAGRS